MNTPNNRRRRESQQRIEEAFTALLAEKELNRISVTDICAMAGVNRTTFYANYTDVYALAEAVKEGLKREVLSLYPDELQSRESSFDFLRLLRHIKENQLLYKTYFRLATDDDVTTFGYDRVASERYYGNRHISYHIAFFSSGLNAVIKQWLSGGCRETPEEIDSIIKTEYAK